MKLVKLAGALLCAASMTAFAQDNTQPTTPPAATPEATAPATPPATPPADTAKPMMEKKGKKKGMKAEKKAMKKKGKKKAEKMEGGEKRVEMIRRVIDAEIPVAGHIGLTPQSINMMGGYKVQGKTLSAIEQLMRDAVALDRAGVACIYLEGIPREVAAMITA